MNMWMFINLYVIFICLTYSLIPVYIIGKMCTGKGENAKGKKVGREVGEGEQRERRIGYRARKNTNFTFLHKFWCQ